MSITAGNGTLTHRSLNVYGSSITGHLPVIQLALILAALQGASDTLRLTLVVDDTSSRATLVHGATLGAEEAMRTGRLFGTAATLRMVSAHDSARLDLLVRGGVPRASMILLAADSATCAKVAAAAALQQVAVFDAGCPVHSVPAAPNAYSLVSRASASAPSDSARLELWHWSLDRFGGEQLNQRYQRRFGERMDSRAWSGWFAAKMGLDLALRAHSTDGATMLRLLSSGRQQFDGQKGRPLYFAPDDHRLVQPLYRVVGRGDDERVIAEIAP
ncbi:MAG TPA: ABC transporter substrate-binding protein [Gemmatimonadaceae bacterium]